MKSQKCSNCMNYETPNNEQPCISCLENRLPKQIEQFKEKPEPHCSFCKHYGTSMCHQCTRNPYPRTTDFFEFNPRCGNCKYLTTMEQNRNCANKPPCNKCSGCNTSLANGFYWIPRYY